MNTITITGNLTKPPKVFSEKFAVMRIAANYIDRDNVSQVMYFEIKLFSLKDLTYYSPKTGDRVTVFGEFILEEYDGKKEMVIKAERFDKLWRQPKSNLRPKETTITESTGCRF